MFAGISRGGRALPCAVWSISNVTNTIYPGCAQLHHLTAQQPEPVAQVLVVQDRSQSELQTQEALRLAQTYAGEDMRGGEPPHCIPIRGDVT
jgi:hypothetical protein